MKYMTIDKNGVPTSFFSLDVHGDKIPDDAIEISDLHWREFITNPIGERGWDGSEIYSIPAPAPDISIQFTQERNRLLSATDWTQLADAPVNQQAWAAYRQALRDLPESPDPQWPEAPTT